MKKPSLKSALVAFFGSRNAVGEGSLKAWGAQQRPPVGASTAEALADELVAEGVASVEERSGGRRVWRLVREELTPEPVPEEEPVAVAGAEEPCQGCADLTCARDALRTDLARERAEQGRQLSDVRLELAHVRQERDALRTEADGMRQAAIFSEALLREVAAAVQCGSTRRDVLLLAAHKLREERDEALRERDDLAREVMTLRQERDLAKGEVFGMRAELARSQAPTLDQGAIAHYLLSLPEERWASLATARQQLAQARELEASARATVDRLLSAPAEAPEPVPAPELAPAPPSAPPPPPPPQAKRGRRTEDGEPAPGTARAKILAWIRQQPDATARVATVAERFDEHAADMSAVLIGMTRAGYLERVSTGFYRAVKP